MINTYCVPFALGKLSGRSTNEIADMIRSERGEGWERRIVAAVYGWETDKALHSLGLKVLAEVRRPGLTLRKWAANRVKWGDKNPWLVSITGHALVYRDGKFYDNGKPSGIEFDAYRYAGSRLKIARQFSPECWTNENPQLIGI